MVEDMIAIMNDYLPIDNDIEGVARLILNESCFAAAQLNLFHIASQIGQRFIGRLGKKVDRLQGHHFFDSD